mmetsp:Transcript_26484/g.35290  ORF Transcript_26484/g.35290 Transcript_26484/m.35290 type:complete len:455 (+) Transcript_26484:152-1516(+)
MMDRTKHRMQTSQSVPLLSRLPSATRLSARTTTCKKSDEDIEHQMQHGFVDTSKGPLVKKVGSERPFCAESLKSSDRSSFPHSMQKPRRKRGNGGSYGLSSEVVKTASSVLFTLWLFLACVMLLYFRLDDFDGVSSHGGDKLDLISSLRGGEGSALEEATETPTRKIQFRPSVPPIFSSSKHIPIPLPPNKVSVVIMNHSRPRMIRESSLMNTLLAHPSVDEVLLLHSNPNTAFEYVHPKVKNIDASQHNDKMGLSLRFYFCQHAKNDWVIQVDDDMEFTPSTFSELLIEFAKDSHRIVGRFGRDFSEGSMFNGYSSSNTHKTTEVVLTKFMIMEQNICSSFFELSHLIWDDVILHDGEGPMWNGEDIFMSLVANHVYGGINNYAMDWLDVWNAPDYLKDYDSGKLDISGGFSGYTFWDWKWWQNLLRRNRHYAYRGTLWNTARRRLAELGDNQ